MDKLNLEYEGELIEIDTLKRSKNPLISKVKLDIFTDKVNENFDYDFNGQNKFYPFEFNDILKDLDFNILCIEVLVAVVKVHLVNSLEMKKK